MFKYIHGGIYHSDTTESYMTAHGLDEGAQQSVLNQQAFELMQPPEHRALFKHNRQKQLDTLTVEVDGMVFDGDEASQSRMGRASFSLEPGETINWVLATNEAQTVTKEQLAKALRLAGAKQAEFWTQQTGD